MTDDFPEDELPEDDPLDEASPDEGEAVGDNAFDVLRAVQRFLGLGLKDGDVIRHETLCADVLRCEMPNLEGCAAEYRDAQIARMQRWRLVQIELLRHHSLAFRSRPGWGYEVVPPATQAGWAEAVAREKIAGIMDKAMMRARFVRTDDLSADELRARTDTLARLGQMRQALDRRVRADTF